MQDRAARYSLTGLQRTYLETVRDRITDDDRAPALVAGVDADGMVYWRPEPLREQLAYLVAKWIWDETVE